MDNEIATVDRRDMSDGSDDWGVLIAEHPDDLADMRIAVATKRDANRLAKLLNDVACHVEVLV